MTAIAVLAVTVHAENGPQVASEATVPKAEPVVTVKLTLAEMKDRAGTLRTQVKGHARRVRHLQEVARKEKDIVKLTCVNDKLVELKPQVNMFDAADQSFQLALDDSIERVRELFEPLGGGASTIKQLRTDAESCIGVPDLYKDSRIEVTHPELDEPANPFDTPLEPPAYASPYN